MYGCGLSSQNDVNPGFFEAKYTVPYQLNTPTQIMKMDKQLVEISGLAYSNSKNKLYAINDEDALIFVIDPLSGSILKKYDFGKSDDYEGVAIYDNTIYVSESNGNIKLINETDGKKYDEYDDRLSRKNNVEGLCYNSVNKKLLMAAKGNSEIDGNDKNFKSIFEMNLSDGQISKTPYIQHDLQEAIKNLEPKYISENKIINLSFSSRINKYGPSGVAVHPISKDIYILSAQGKMLVISSQEGKINAVIFLKNSLHVQPEGITFSSDGSLYISNEGKSGKGLIYRYDMKQSN